MNESLIRLRYPFTGVEEAAASPDQRKSRVVRMFFPVQTSTVSGTQAKIVTCCGCKRSYRYFARRTGSGNATALIFFYTSRAKQEALERAEKDLADELDRAIDPVPCPNCGTLQPHMNRKPRNKKRTALFLLGAGIGVVAAFIHQSLK